jgi:hypothetical protein
MLWIRSPLISKSLNSVSFKEASFLASRYCFSILTISPPISGSTKKFLSSFSSERASIPFSVKSI